MKYEELINLEHYHNINYLHFQDENRKYMKQYIVMKIYNKMKRCAKDNGLSKVPEPHSLSEIWSQVNAYFDKIEMPVRKSRTQDEIMQSAYNSTATIGYMGSISNS